MLRSTCCHWPLLLTHWPLSLASVALSLASAATDLCGNRGAALSDTFVLVCAGHTAKTAALRMGELFPNCLSCACFTKVHGGCELDLRTGFLEALTFR